MKTSILLESKDLNHYNLSFTLDNFQITIHRCKEDVFHGISGIDTHQHAGYELHYICSGKGHAVFCDKSFELSAGDVFLIAPYTPHKQIILDQGIHKYTLLFNIQRLNYHSNNETINEESIQIIRLLEATSNRLIHGQFSLCNYFEQAFYEIDHKRPGYYLVTKQAIMNAIIHVARLSYDAECPSPTYSLPAQNAEVSQMEQISEFIHNHLSTHLSNEAMAQRLHISDRQLHRLIKKHAGMSPHQYVTSMRIEYVKSLMQNSNYTLRTISEMAGFSSEFHLSSAFKKLVHMTPREYIQKVDSNYTEAEGLW